MKELIQSWRPRKWYFRHELKSLIGHFHHAAKMVWPGRTFFRRMIDLLSCFRKKDHPIWLNKEFHLNLQWWNHLLAQWHGISFWLYPVLSPAVDLEVASDATGSLGFGAYFQGFWLAGPWAVSQQQQALASPFQLNTSRVSSIKSLMLVSNGRNSDSWSQLLIQPQHRFLPSFFRNCPVSSRTALSPLPYAWPSPIHSQDLCNR